MKKWLLMFFLLALALSAALAETPQTYHAGDYSYILLEDGTASISRYVVRNEKLVLPSELDGHPVSAISDGAIVGSYLTTVQIPDSIVYLEGNPFWKCPRLTKIQVSPEHPTLAVIDGALYSKPDKQLVSYPAMYEADSCTIPQGIRSIGDHAFYDAYHLSAIVIPNTVTVIGEECFYNAVLQSVAIPASVTSIGKGAFQRCKHLTAVTFGENSCLTEIGDHAFQDTAIISIDLPDSLTHIGSCTFCDCWQMTSADLPDGLRSIGQWAFSGTGLVCVELPDGLTTIGHEAFTSCFNLTTVCLPASVTVLVDRQGSDASPFSLCGALTNIIVADENPVYEDIDGVLFHREKKKLLQYPVGRMDAAYTIPEGTLAIGSYAMFRYPPPLLQEITIPASVVEIADDALFDPESADSCHFTFTVPRDSYAHQWCRQRQLTYSFPDSFDWLLN